MSFDVTAKLPSAQDFVSLRREAHWGQINSAQAKAALSASLAGVSLWDNKTCIGMARVIGDGVLNLYIQDVIITKAHRGQGYGAKLLGALISNLKQSYPPECTIGLMAAKGQAPFYARFGFAARPSPTTDAGMNAALGQLEISPS